MVIVLIPLPAPCGWPGLDRQPHFALPGVFAVTAAAGAAMAAYSKRRVENERAKAEGEES